VQSIAALSWDFPLLRNIVSTETYVSVYILFNSVSCEKVLIYVSDFLKRVNNNGKRSSLCFNQYGNPVFKDSAQPKTKKLPNTVT
jgi:hypothetical protein